MCISTRPKYGEWPTQGRDAGHRSCGLPRGSLVLGAPRAAAPSCLGVVHVSHSTQRSAQGVHSHIPRCCRILGCDTCVHAKTARRGSGFPYRSMGKSNREGQCHAEFCTWRCWLRRRLIWDVTRQSRTVARLDKIGTPQKSEGHYIASKRHF